MKLQVGVKILIQNNNQQFLFIRRAQAFAGEDVPHWDIPGGRIEPEEPLLEALAREIKEETGLSIDNSPQLQAAQDIFVSHADLHVVRLTYLAHGEGKPKISDEHQEVAWMTQSEALSTSIDPYIREVLEKQKSA
ncbi:MAG TPA: NUDIX hydrolase [Candidatus Saccharimonadales bacterium]|nr:NUDIX hydrolase [Candidatus Saccharimonadales bacterium]